MSIVLILVFEMFLGRLKLPKNQFTLRTKIFIKKGISSLNLVNWKAIFFKKIKKGEILLVIRLKFVTLREFFFIKNEEKEFFLRLGIFFQKHTHIKKHILQYLTITVKILI